MNAKASEANNAGYRKEEGGTMPEPVLEEVDELAVVAMLRVTCPLAVTDGGLKVQVASAGKFPHANVIVPRFEPLFAVTLRTLVAVPPAGIVAEVV